MEKEKCCCFIGHRKIDETEELRSRLYEVIEALIRENDVDTFFFGSKSEFDSLCYEIVSILKEKYPRVKRIYIRAEFPYIDERYKNYLLQYYEDTYYPERIIQAGRAVYVERNYEMIDKSDFCVVYCDENYRLSKRKSGTRIACEYIKQKNKRIINISD